jgi:membrane-associated phospholipid phosphatase
MHLPLLIIFLFASAIMMVIERLGVPTTLQLQMKGDVKRETRWLAQYGQFTCTPIGALIAWQLDPRGWKVAVPIIASVVVASIIAMLIKRTLGRVRPGREDAGKFLGPTIRHANYRESFPSSHTACAFAFSGVLAWLYPQAAVTFWVLASACGFLRYVLDAHWPSDVLAGVALGIGCAWLSMHYWMPVVS